MQVTPALYLLRTESMGQMIKPTRIKRTQISLQFQTLKNWRKDKHDLCLKITNVNRSYCQDSNPTRQLNEKIVHDLYTLTHSIRTIHRTLSKSWYRTSICLYTSHRTTIMLLLVSIETKSYHSRSTHHLRFMTMEVCHARTTRIRLDHGVISPPNENWKKVVNECERTN